MNYCPLQIVACYCPEAWYHIWLKSSQANHCLLFSLILPLSYNGPLLQMIANYCLGAWYHIWLKSWQANYCPAPFVPAGMPPKLLQLVLKFKQVFRISLEQPGLSPIIMIIPTNNLALQTWKTWGLHWGLLLLRLDPRDHCCIWQSLKCLLFKNRACVGSFVLYDDVLMILIRWHYIWQMQQARISYLYLFVNNTWSATPAIIEGSRLRGTLILIAGLVRVNPQLRLSAHSPLCPR